MFEDQDLQIKNNNNDDVFDYQNNSGNLNNKLVQENNIKDFNSSLNEDKSNSKVSTYQDKLHNNQMAEDIFADSDKDSSQDQHVIKANSLSGGLSPIQPLTNYHDLIAESNNLHTHKIKARYFFVGLFVILLLISALGFWIYKQFFIGVRDSGEIILNTDSQEINLDQSKNKFKQDNKIVEPGVNVNSTAVSNDIDGDGLTNEEEKVLQTDPEQLDTDHDGLSDREELKIYHTDPLHDDTDGDGWPDGEEIENGYNPLGAGRLFNFDLITNTKSNDNNQNTIKELIKPNNIDINSWSSFASSNFHFNFKYPFDWSINEENNKIIVSPLDEQIKDYVEIEIRNNILQLDLVDWLNTQVDYPDFKQEQLKINDNIGLLVHSDDPKWKSLSSIFISHNDLVYNFNFFSDNNSSDALNIFQLMVLTSVFK